MQIIQKKTSKVYTIHLGGKRPFHAKISSVWQPKFIRFTTKFDAFYDGIEIHDIRKNRIYDAHNAFL